MSKCEVCGLPLLEEICIYRGKTYSRMACLNCEQEEKESDEE